MSSLGHVHAEIRKIYETVLDPGKLRKRTGHASTLPTRMVGGRRGAFTRAESTAVATHARIRVDASASVDAARAHCEGRDGGVNAHSEVAPAFRGSEHVRHTRYVLELAR